MFKNDFKLTQSYTLSKKERVDLIKSLTSMVDLYNAPCLEYIQNNFTNISAQKISIGNVKKRILIFEGNPIFFEYDKDVFYPSVYLMNMFPDILKRRAIMWDETDSYLDNGADLMLKGVLNREEIMKTIQFNMGSIFMIITVTGVVTSLGQALMAPTTMNLNQPSGKFLKIVHRLNDYLWNLGTKKIPSQVFKIVSKVEGNEESNVETNVESNTDNNLTNKDNENKIENEAKKEINKNKFTPEIEKEKNEIEGKELNEPSLTPEENDNNINTLFLTMALWFKHNRDKPQNENNGPLFPMDPGKLLKDYLKPLSAELNLPFDFKNSSFKKINNYMKHLQKEKLVAFGKPKGIQNDFIHGIDFNHPMLNDFKPPVKKIKFISEKMNSHNDEEKDNVILQKDEKIEVSQLYKPNQTIKPFFEQYDKTFESSAYYPIKHCTDILTAYLKDKDLFLKGGIVKVNDMLKKSLYKYDNKDNNKYVDDEAEVTCKMDELLLRWKKNLNEKSFITKTGSNNEQTILSNNQLKIKIHARKISNKNVTIIDGLQNFANVKDVIKIFSKHFACSVTLKDFQNVKDAIFIQGYWVSELVDLLQSEIKLKKEFIQVEDKLKIKNKKK